MNLDTSLPLFDAAASRVAMETAITTVHNNSVEWSNLAYIEICSKKQFYHDTYPNGFTAEHIRTWLTPLVGNPHHHNGWSAFFRRCLRANVIQDTGRWCRASFEGSHSRKLPIYVWGGA